MAPSPSTHSYNKPEILCVTCRFRVFFFPSAGFCNCLFPLHAFRVGGRSLVWCQTCVLSLDLMSPFCSSFPSLTACSLTHTRERNCSCISFLHFSLPTFYTIFYLMTEEVSECYRKPIDSLLESKEDVTFPSSSNFLIILPRGHSSLGSGRRNFENMGTLWISCNFGAYN